MLTIVKMFSLLLDAKGSILGPLVFTIYVNCGPCLYADDSALVISGKDPMENEFRLSQELQSLSFWWEANKLFQHLGKMESILFASKIRLRM